MAVPYSAADSPALQCIPNSPTIRPSSLPGFRILWNKLDDEL
jgi:hypothetical protein